MFRYFVNDSLLFGTGYYTKRDIVFILVYWHTILIKCMYVFGSCNTVYISSGARESYICITFMSINKFIIIIIFVLLMYLLIYRTTYALYHCISFTSMWIISKRWGALLGGPVSLLLPFPVIRKLFDL